VENTNNEEVFQKARDEIWQSWRRACALNVDHPSAKELFDRNKLPPFHDPFAGSGALPLEAQRLGLEAYASDLNPVAVLICKATIEIPPKFADKPAVNSEARKSKDLLGRQWRGAQGLAEDVRYYGEWMRDEAEKRIGHLYPKIEVTAGIAKGRPDLKRYIGKKLSVVAWLWARTVKSPNPAFADMDVPLASTFFLSTKTGKEVYVEPVIEDRSYRFTVKMGKSSQQTQSGTKLNKGAFRCIMSNVPIPYEYIDNEANAGRVGTRLMAIVAEGERGRLYLPPTEEHSAAAASACPTWKPDVPSRGTWASNAQGRRYGFATYGDYFTARQLVALTTLSDLVAETMERVRRDAVAAGLADDGSALREGGRGAAAYAQAVGVYLALAIDRAVDYNSSLATWRPKDSAMRSSLAKQAIPMTWDFAEGSIFGDSSAGFAACVDVITSVMRVAFANQRGIADQANAAAARETSKLIAVRSTDPPYYDNVSYADLSDFFYVWQRRSLATTFPELFATVSTPKGDELIATPYRHGSKENAAAFFLRGMTEAMHRLAEQAYPTFPVTIYYAFKQAEEEDEAGTASTGWETFLDAVIRAGFSISGTWPMRTEGDNRQVGIGANALASSIVLVCRKRAVNAQNATRREFIAALKAELPTALTHLQGSNIAPVDLAQAAIGPGMGVYTRYAKVLDAEGKPVSVRDALALINQTLDEALAEQEGDFDSDTRWALAWFEQNGFGDGEYGVAEVLATAKVTAVSGLADAGIVKSGRGKVRLLKPAELDAHWNPASDKRLTAWESVHQLIRALEGGGESAAAELAAKLGAKAEVARELAYRLYVIAERKKRANEALSYNGLVQSWPEIQRLARESREAAAPAQAELL
jgi:putative DNA methylase